MLNTRHSVSTSHSLSTVEEYSASSQLKGFQFSSLTTHAVGWYLMSLNPSQRRNSLSADCCCQSLDKDYTFLLQLSQSEARDGCQPTNERPGCDMTQLSPGVEIMFSKFSHDIQWFEYSGKWRLLEAILNGQIIGLGNFFTENYYILEYVVWICLIFSNFSFAVSSESCQCTNCILRILP